MFMKAMGRKGLGSVMGEELREKLDNPIVFKALNSDLGHGYDCTVLIDICDTVGIPALRAHLWQVIGIGNSVKSKSQFERSFYTAFPAPKTQLDAVKLLD